MRRDGWCMPWKPDTTATSPSRVKPSMMPVPSMAAIRAEPWASEVWIGICQPCQERALSPIS
jgi:hypothetical protein